MLRLLDVVSIILISLQKGENIWGRVAFSGTRN